MVAAANGLPCSCVNALAKGSILALIASAILCINALRSSISVNAHLAAATFAPATA